MKPVTKYNLVNNIKVLLQNTILIVVSISIAMLIGEFVVRIYAPQDLRFNVTQWDEYTGFWHIPNIEGYTKHRDYTMLVSINSKGLRNKEYTYDKPENTVRIAVFGDSFTFGEGVQNEETYTAQLEALFNSNNAKFNKWNIEVINFGVGKTGTSHQYALYKKEGVRYHADIVVLGFLGGNDFDDNKSGVFTIKDGALKHNPTAYSSIRKIQTVVYSIPFYRWLASNSHLVNFARIAATRAYDRSRVKEYTANAISDTGAEFSAYQLTEMLVDEFRAEVNSNSKYFVFLNLPAKNQKLLNDYAAGEILPSFVKDTSELIRHAEASGSIVIDLVPIFSGIPIGQNYFEHDGHMNASGHRMIAEQLYDKLLPLVDRVTHEK